MPVSGMLNAEESWTLTGVLKPAFRDDHSATEAAPKQARGSSGKSNDQVSLSSEAKKLGTLSDLAWYKTDADLTDEQRREIVELEKMDKHVRAHEQAHLSAAGGVAIGPPHFEYQTGPDGKRYANGGEVQLDTSPVPGDPGATIKKEEQVERAASAPVDPSLQDRRVAARAAALVQQAQAELAQKKAETSGSRLDLLA